MADKKISQLSAASTPLAGTEVLPIVQSNATVKVATDDLTVKNVRSNATTGILQVAGPSAAATRVMTVPDANFTAARTDAAQSFTGNQTLSTGNLIIGTSGKGIDFSATPSTGTSELLNDYEEGTWTPIVGGDATYTVQEGYYVKIGRFVYVQGKLVVNVLGTGSTTSMSGLPFTSINTPNFSSGTINVTLFISLAASAVSLTGTINTNSTQTSFYNTSTAATTTQNIGYAIFGDGTRLDFTGYYMSAT